MDTIIFDKGSCRLFGLVVVRATHREPDSMQVDGLREVRSSGTISTTWVESGGISGNSTVVSRAGGGLRYRDREMYCEMSRSEPVSRCCAI